MDPCFFFNIAPHSLYTTIYIIIYSFLPADFVADAADGVAVVVHLAVCRDSEIEIHGNSTMVWWQTIRIKPLMRCLDHGEAFCLSKRYSFHNIILRYVYVFIYLYMCVCGCVYLPSLSQPIICLNEKSPLKCS